MENLINKAISKTEAKRRKLTPFTHSYEPSEYWMLKRLINEQLAAGSKIVLVVENPRTPTKISVWRK